MIGRVIIVILLFWNLVYICRLETKQDEIINKHNEVRMVTAKMLVDVLRLKGE